MAPGDHPETASVSHWVRWHAGYEDPSSGLSLRLRTVQEALRQALDSIPESRPGPIRVVSMCAGQGRDVIDVVATHPRRQAVSALLVELDPALAAFARDRAREAGVGDSIRVVEADASQCRWYANDVPADVVLVCGVFGNISGADISHTIQALPGFCRPGGHVIWTRHRREPDATPSIRADFAAAGFTEVVVRGARGLDLVRRPPSPGQAGQPGPEADGLRPGPDAVRLRRGRVRTRMTGPDDDGGADLDHLLKPLPDPATPAPKRRRRRRRYDRSVRPVRRHRPDRHPLHPVELLLMAWRTVKLEPGRVIVPALVIFGLDAFQSTFFTEISTDHLGLESLSTVVFLGVSTLGLTFYSGMLERLVGAVERNQTPEPVGRVLATLPWLRLLLAEAILVVIGAIAALFFIIPGLIVGTLMALVGPMINLLNCSVPDALRRSVRLVWPHFWLVFVMVTIPLAAEHELVVLIADVVHHESVYLVFLTNFILGASFGLALGLVEVSLAERLISGAHGPGESLQSTDIEFGDGVATT